MQSDLPRYTSKRKPPPKLTSPTHHFKFPPMQAKKPKNPAEVPKIQLKEPQQVQVKVSKPPGGDPDRYYNFYIPPVEFGDQWHFLVEFFNFAQASAVAWVPNSDGVTTNWKETRLQQANAAVRQLDNLSRTVC